MMPRRLAAVQHPATTTPRAGWIVNGGVCRGAERRVKRGERWSLIVFFFGSCRAQRRYFGSVSHPARVRGEIMGSHKRRIVGGPQSVLMMIDPSISTRTCPPVRDCGSHSLWAGWTESHLYATHVFLSDAPCAGWQQQATAAAGWRAAAAPVAGTLATICCALSSPPACRHRANLRYGAAAAAAIAAAALLAAVLASRLWGTPRFVGVRLRASRKDE
jgi:hypothetical protein